MNESSSSQASISMFPNINDEIKEEIRVSEKQLDSNAHFFATFTDGSSFRAMIDYIRFPNTHAIFIFTKDKILYQQGSSDHIILNDIKINSYELTDYEFYSESDVIFVNCSLVDLKDVTKSVGKKDHIDLYRLEGEPQNLYLQVRAQGEKGTSEPLKSLISCSPANSVDFFEPPQYTRGKKNPNCTIYQSDFSKFCKNIANHKCSYVMAHGLERGLIFKGITNKNTVCTVKEFGKCTQGNASVKPKSFFTRNTTTIIKPKSPPPTLNIGELGEIERFKIPMNIIKYLTKLAGLSPNGSIKIYIEKDKPLKLLCDIGSFGKLNVYLSC